MQQREATGWTAEAGWGEGWAVEAAGMVAPGSGVAALEAGQGSAAEARAPAAVGWAAEADWEEAANWD